MKRSELIGLLVLGVAVASLFDACRAAIGLEFWHLFAASQEDINVFCKTFVLDLLVLSALCILGPILVGLILGEFLTTQECITDHQTARERQLQRSRRRRAARLRSTGLGD
ncbi:hypothetical protein WT83_29095 [Burkholderia territorii]|uniref:Uncharacterized protein n=1 Tax=Burkholderia territorii TaxID=1503055 RepID=A0A108E641_9BURK|nr:hypothetical protein [Burkholderia territorii]KWN05412.1 hypothetical protein WT83_29095 [Burkholderia territorii]